MARYTKCHGPGLPQVRAVVAGLTLSGDVSLEQTARHLGTSPRSLQRHLRARGVRFRSLVEASRFQIAGALLQETDLSVHEIAAQIGYRSPGAFTRAFTRWAGRTPRAYRAAGRRRRDD